MPSRVRFYSHVVFTVLAFATVGRAPRLLPFTARDLPPVGSTMIPGADGNTPNG